MYSPLLSSLLLRPRAVCAAAGFFLALTPVTTADDALPPTARHELDAIVAGEVAGSPQVSGLQMVVISGGEVAFEYAAGIARTGEAGSIPLSLDHKVRVASISKLVATIGLMRLVEAGKVDLDRDVSDYLGFNLRNPNFPNDEITLRMTLSHSSSIRDGSYYWLKGGEQFEEFFKPYGKHYEGGAHFASGKNREPGEYFTYSNLNFGIMAGVIEKVTGKRFDRYMRESVLEPLGLSASYNVCDVSANEPEAMASLFRKRDDDGNWHPDGDWVPQLDHERFYCFYGMEPVARGEAPGPILKDYTPGQNPTLFSPQGGLRASARDLAKVAQLLLAGGETADGKRLLDPQTVGEMAQPIWVYDARAENGNTTGEDLDPNGPSKRLMNAYGLSTHIVDLRDWGVSDDSHVLVGHLGDAYGLMGQFWIDFENNAALVALITGTADDPAPGGGTTPMYRAEDEVLRWWWRWFGAAGED